VPMPFFLAMDFCVRENSCTKSCEQDRAETTPEKGWREGWFPPDLAHDFLARFLESFRVIGRVIFKNRARDRPKIVREIS